jgi:hypothetical protein
MITARSQRTLTLLSLGAGVQSSTLLLMACRGDLPQPDAVIFADTGDEPQAVYRHLAWLDGMATAAGIRLYRVSGGHIRDDLLRAVAGGERRVGHIGQPPFFVRNPVARTEVREVDTLWGRETVAARSPDTGGRLWRKCTQEYKLLPIRRQTRALMQAAGAQSVDQWLGISWDELHRMKPSGVRYITNRFPLIERRMTRQDCLIWLDAHGYPTPPKSACVLCPFHSDTYWQGLKDNAPDEWARAVEVDAAIRRGIPGVTGEAFLHRSMVPLPLVMLRPQDDRQMNLFGAECEGVCGL